MREYFKLLRFLWPYKGLLGIAGLCMFFSAIFDGASLSMIVPLTDKVLTNKQIVVPNQLPAFLADFLKSVNSTPPLHLIKIIAFTVLVIFLLKGLFGFWQGYIMSDIGQRVIRDLRLQLYRKLQSLSLDYFSQRRSGELISRITNDVRVIENAVSYGFTDLIYQSLQVVVFTFLIFFIYFKMALMSLILFPLVAAPMAQLGRKLRKLSRRSQERMADINSLLLETITGVRIVKAFNMEGYEINRFAGQNRDFYKLTMKSIKRNLLLNPIMEIIGAMVGITIFYWMGKEVISGKLSFGVFGLFMGALLSLIRPFKKLSQVNAMNQQALAASVRIYEVLDAEPTVKESSAAAELEEVKEKIVFENVSFRYEAFGGEVLQNINLDIKVGQIVALVGPTGAGKSTLANLLPRFYDPQEGRITIDGRDIRDFTIKSLRQQIGMVTQETILFNDTVRANIAYGHLEAPEAQVREAAQRAFAHNFIMKMPLNYETVIGDRGFKLSGGERQRLAIARAILKNPPILILDEATSQLDSESERLVQEALDELMQGRTVICIAHRLSTIKKADRIVVINEGRMVGLGSHDALLNDCPLYKKLYETQFLT